MAWQYDLKFGVADIENDMRLIEAIGARDENRMFVRKISDDELVFGFRFSIGPDRALNEAETACYPGYHRKLRWQITKYDLFGNRLNVKQREIIESAMPHYSNRFGGFSVQIDGVDYKSLCDVEYVDDIAGY